MDVLNGVISELRSVCASLPDKRTGSNIRYEMADFGLSAFSLFFMQSPSFLAHQRALSRARERSNGETLFAMSRIPTDNQIRAMLDPVTPDRLYPLFASLRERLERGGGLRPFRRLDGHLLVALDGTEYFCSAKISRSNGSRRKRGDGAVEYHHNMVTAARVAPGHARAIPLAPEVVVPQDGQEKQDCESRAARRWLAAHGPGLARLKPICIGDDLYSRQPICETVQAAGGHCPVRCQAGIAPHAPRLARRRRTPRPRRAGQKGPRLPNPSLPLAHQPADPRWRGRAHRQRARRRDHQHDRQRHLPQQLRHRSGRRFRATSPSLPRAGVPVGRSRTRPSTCSRTTATISNTTSATARRT